MSLKSDFELSDFEVCEETKVWDGFFDLSSIRLRHKKFDGSWSPVISRELFHRGEAAAAVLYDPERDLIGLVDQFRVGALDSEFGPWCLEAVAGMMEQDETAEQLILREIEEEAGIKNPKLIPISHYYSSPGGSGEKIYLYCALCDLGDAEGIHGRSDENEDIFLRTFDAQELFSNMFFNRTNNAATLISLLWLKDNRKVLRVDMNSSLVE